MFSTWPKRRVFITVLAVPAQAVIALFALLAMDGDAYDRWRHAHHLRMIHQAWRKDGSPEPPQVERYVGASSSSTTFVYSASQVIGGHTYQGLFAYRTTLVADTFVITRTGEVFVIDDSGRARLLRIHKTKAAAW